MPLLVTDKKDLTIAYKTAFESLIGIANRYYFAGRLDEAERLLDTSLQLARGREVEEQDHLELLFPYIKVQIAHHLVTHQTKDQLFAAVHTAREVARTCGRQDDIAEALSLQAQAYLFTTVVTRLGKGKLPFSYQGEEEAYETSLTHQKEALTLREQINDVRGISESHFFIGNMYQFWQMNEEAHTHFSKALQIAQDADLLFEQVEPNRHLALLAMGSGDMEQALTFALRALSLREEVKFRPYQPLDHLLLQSIYHAQGDHQKAQVHTQQALTLALEMGCTAIVSSIQCVG